MSTPLRTLLFATAVKDVLGPKLPVILVDLETGEVVYATDSSAGIFGYEAKELIGLPVELLVPHEFRDQHKLWRGARERSEGLSVMGKGRQVYGVKKNGVKFPASVTLTSMEVEGKSYDAALIVDLTSILVTPEMI